MGVLSLAAWAGVHPSGCHSPHRICRDQPPPSGKGIVLIGKNCRTTDGFLAVLAKREKRSLAGETISSARRTLLTWRIERITMRPTPWDSGREEPLHDFVPHDFVTL